MPFMNPDPEKTAYCKPFILIVILICLLYSNTLHNAWHLDDINNILRNPGIQMRSLNWDAIINTFFASPDEDSLYRPVAYFSFALNWMWGQDNLVGYRMVNIGIHMLTAIFLFLSISLLFQTPNARSTDYSSVYFIALLSAVLWAIHPIQTQAVTYVVQRMASMSAMFYIIAVFCYLKARLSFSGYARVIFSVCCALAFLLALGTKSNAIMLPLILILMEFIFFRNLKDPKTRKLAAVFFLGMALIVAATGFFLFMGGNANYFFNELYELRFFSMYERLLTQPSVILFYLSQIFYPIAERFSIEHDFVISTSLFTPWTTFPAIIIVLSLIIFAFFRITKNPLLAFAILFYFGNHVIESSILPLEMVFEHRNYLPSLFLFVPVAMGLKKAFDHYSVNRKPLYYLLVFFACTFMILLGTSTYVRNEDWRSPKSLWEDAAKKAPQASRPLSNLAYVYYTPAGQTNKALALYQKALTLTGRQTVYKASIYNNIAAIYSNHLNEYEKAVAYAKKAIELVPYGASNMILCDSLSMLGQYEKALQLLDELLETRPDNIQFLYRKGFILLKISRPGDALEYFSQCLRLSPEDWRCLREIGICFTQMEQYEKGYWFLRRADALRPKSPDIYLSLAGNRIRAGDSSDVVDYFIDRFINQVGIEYIESYLVQLSVDPLGIPVFFAEVSAPIGQNIRKRSEKHRAIAFRLKERFPPVTHDSDL